MGITSCLPLCFATNSLGRRFPIRDKLQIVVGQGLVGEGHRKGNCRLSCFPFDVPAMMRYGHARGRLKADKAMFSQYRISNGDIKPHNALRRACAFTCSILSGHIHCLLSRASALSHLIIGFCE